MFKAAEANGLGPDMTSFNSLLLAYVRATPVRMEDALELVEVLKAKGLAPNQITFSTLISGCARSRPVRLIAALQAMENMAAMGLTPNRVTYATLINTIAKVRQLIIVDRFSRFLTYFACFWVTLYPPNARCVTCSPGVRMRIECLIGACNPML